MKFETNQIFYVLLKIYEFARVLNFLCDKVDNGIELDG